jgi:hypothetical protein
MTDNYVDVNAFADAYEAPDNIEAAFYNRASGQGTIPVDNMVHQLTLSHNSPGNEPVAFDPNQAAADLNSAFEMDNNNTPAPVAQSSGPSPGM